MVRTLAAILSLALPLPALADPAPAARPAPPSATSPAGGDTGDCARARRAGKTCELTIETEDVGGSRPDPGDIALRARRFEPAGSLLRLRRDFLPEIVRAAEQL